MLAGPEAGNLDATVPLELVGLERLGEGYVAGYRPGRRGPPAAEGVT